MWKLLLLVAFVAAQPLPFFHQAFGGPCPGCPPPLPQFGPPPSMLSDPCFGAPCAPTYRLASSSCVGCAPALPPRVVFAPPPPPPAPINRVFVNSLPPPCVGVACAPPPPPPVFVNSAPAPPCVGVACVPPPPPQVVVHSAPPPPCVGVACAPPPPPRAFFNAPAPCVNCAPAPPPPQIIFQAPPPPPARILFGQHQCCSVTDFSCCGRLFRSRKAREAEDSKEGSTSPAPEAPTEEPTEETKKEE